MSRPNISYIYSVRPYSKVSLFLGDALKVLVIISSFLIVGIIGVILLNNYLQFQFLSQHQLISLNNVSMWGSVVIPELMALASLFLLGGVGFYIYNQMAYSGYRYGILVIGIIASLFFSGLLMLFINSVPALKSSFRNLEMQIQRPLPSQGYFAQLSKECEKQGYTVGWVERHSNSGIVLNINGKTQRFSKQTYSTVPSSTTPQAGDKILLSSNCAAADTCTHTIYRLY